MKVWKYTLEVVDEATLLLPVGAVPLCVREQGGEACLWALVDPDADLEPWTIRVAGTGHPRSDLKASEYLGSFQLFGGSFVGHVFGGPQR